MPEGKMSIIGYTLHDVLHQQTVIKHYYDTHQISTASVQLL